MSESPVPRAPLDLPGLTVASRLARPAPSAAPRPDGGTRRDPAAHTRRVGGEVGEDVRKALAYVLRSTNAKPQTASEVLAKLHKREVDPDVAHEAVAQARRLGAIDDAKLARAWVEERGVRRGFGRARLHEELLRRQVPVEIVEEAVSVLDERDDLAAATELAKRRFRQLPADVPAEAAARRLSAYVARRGYPAGLAQRVATEVSGLRDRWD